MLNFETLEYDKEINKAFKQRDIFTKENDYELFKYQTCYDCMNFIVNLNDIAHGGNCKLMDEAGAEPAVNACAVCNKFLSCQGKDINGNIIDPSEYPAWVRIKKWGDKKQFTTLRSDLRTYAIKELIVEHLVSLFNLAPEKICKLMEENIKRNTAVSVA